MISKTNRKCILHSICLILVSILLSSSTASAVVETNTTLGDNLVILLDYSGSTFSFRPYIQSNAIYSIQNIEDDSNVSVVVYGGYIKNSNVYSTDTQDNRTILEGFVRNITGKDGDAARDNIYEGFDEARRILYNSTGTKQIVMFSDGNIDEKTKGNLNNDALIKLVKEIKKNVTINLYQVVDTNISPTLKITWVREPYRDLSDKINTDVVILNPDERIRFLKPKSQTVLSGVVNSSQSTSPKSVYMLSERDEYLNEFSNNGETGSVISVMYYDRRDLLSSVSKVHFYTYCSQTCTIVPFDIEQREFFDRQTLVDVFKNKNAIELFKSGNVTESAYTFSFSNPICEEYDSNVLKDESINLMGKLAPNVKPESAKMIKKAKTLGIIKKFRPSAFFAALYCIFPNNDKILDKIADSGIYTDYLKNGQAYNGMIRDFQNSNMEIMEKINDRKNSNWNLLYLFNNPLYDQQLPLIKNNYAQLSQLSSQNYETQAKLAIGRINDKTNESNTFIDNATDKLNELDTQIPFTISETIFNLFKEPETNYTMARLKQDSAESFLKAAKENRDVFKFNSAIQNSNDSIAQSDEGIKFVNIEKSKERYFKNGVKIFGIIALIFLILIMMSKPRQK